MTSKQNGKPAELRSCEIFAVIASNLFFIKTQSQRSLKYAIHAYPHNNSHKRNLYETKLYDIIFNKEAEISGKITNIQSQKLFTIAYSSKFYFR